MKKVMSVSSEERVISEFTALAKEFGTNRTSLINMFMVDFIKNKRISFRRESSINNVSYENFTEKELNELKTEGKASFDSISRSLNKL